MIRIERVKGCKGLYDFGIWFNVYNDAYFTISFGIAFIKALHFIIYWE